MSEGGGVPLGTSGSLGEVDEVAGCSMMILHDYFFELYFCLRSIVEWSEIHFKLSSKIVPIREPGRLWIDFAKNGRFKILEGGAREV